MEHIDFIIHHVKRFASNPEPRAVCKASGNLQGSKNPGTKYHCDYNIAIRAICRYHTLPVIAHIISHKYTRNELEIEIERATKAARDAAVYIPSILPFAVDRSV